MTKLFEFLMKCVVFIIMGAIIAPAIILCAILLWRGSFMDELDKFGDLIWKTKN